jgi:hypothetical protein
MRSAGGAGSVTCTRKSGSLLVRPVRDVWAGPECEHIFLLDGGRKRGRRLATKVTGTCPDCHSGALAGSRRERSDPVPAGAAAQLPTRPAMP